MAIVTTDRRRQPSLLDPEPPPPGGFVPPAGRVATRPGARAPLAASPQRETLEDLIVATWGGLLASHTSACPMCGGDLAPRYSSGARPVGGRCRSCGTELN